MIDHISLSSVALKQVKLTDTHSARLDAWWCSASCWSSGRITAHHTWFNVIDRRHIYAGWPTKPSLYTYRGQKVQSITPKTTERAVQMNYVQSFTQYNFSKTAMLHRHSENDSKKSGVSCYDFLLRACRDSGSGNFTSSQKYVKRKNTDATITYNFRNSDETPRTARAQTHTHTLLHQYIIYLTYS